jgi:DNA-binding NarL/FixJ family response regulator
VVEDSEIVRTRLVAMLAETRGVELAGEAATVADAVARLPAGRPDAVLVDLRLPDGDGFEVIRAAKALTPAPIVVVLTSYAYPQLEARGLAAGADWFLDKSTQFLRVPEILTSLPRMSHQRAR